MEEKRKNYSTEESYKKLFDILSSFGLTYQDIKGEFESPRTKPKNTSGYTFAHGKVLSTPSKIIPERILNGSYAEDTPSLKAWFERDFRNSSIFEHLGDYSVIESIQDDPNVQFNAINGKLYLHEDGNHRLFNYLLLAILDQKKSTSGKDILENREKFALHKKPVHFEHPKTLIDTFDNYVYSSNDHITQNVKDYISETFVDSDAEEAAQSDYLTFDPNSKNYSLYLNGKEYLNLPASKITDIIQTEPELPRGVKIWKAKDTFYIATDNNIFHSKNKKDFSIIVQSVFDHLSPLTPPYANDYLVIKDLDASEQNTTIKTVPKSYSVYNNQDLSNENIIKFREYLSENYKALINNLPIKHIKAIEKIIASTNNSSIDLPALEFYGLTEERTDEIEEILIKGLNILNPEKKQEYEQSSIN